MFKKHRGGACVIALLLFVLLSSMAFGQGTNATLSGTVQDVSGGVLVGATITVRNVDTGIETRATTNNAGIYNLVLQPGNYEVHADATGFQRTNRNIRLGAGSQTNLSLPMAVAGAVTEIEVTGTVESMILEASASTGTVIAEEIIQAIPTLNSNAIEATINVMGGVTRMTSGSTVFSASGQQIAGISSEMINVSRDGITVNEVRNPTGIAAASNINPEVVGEMRVILSPVDAELGRGAGQIQVITRSGSNAFHGSAIWNNQNTAMDATDFSVKQRGLTQNWRNINNYTLTASGPVIKNRTFFFFSWEQQIARDKMIQIPRVMTSCARRGIYRWLTSPDAASLQGRPDPNTSSGWLPNVITATNQYALNTGNLRSVNDDGTPWKGGQVWDTGVGGNVTVAPTTVMFESIFGELTQDARNQLLNDPQYGVWGNGVDGCTVMDKLGYDPMNAKFLTTTDGENTNYWTSETYRYAYDPTGFADRFARTGADYNAGHVVMPPATYFRGQGDGLNSAGYRWTTLMVGQGSSNYGTGGDPDRKAITARVDHNINSDHRLSGTFTWENFYVWDAYRVWPEEYGGYHGDITRKPFSISLTLNSTLAPTLLNEFRFGVNRSNTWVYKALDSVKNADNMKSVLDALSANGASNPYYAGSWAQDQTLLIGLGAGDGDRVNFTNELNATAYRPDVNPVMGATDNIDRSHPYGTRGNLQATWGGNDPRWSFAENMTWIKGSHSFKAGVEYRRQSSYQATQGTTDSFSRGGGNTNLFTVRGGLAGAPTVNTDGQNGPSDLRRRGSLARRGFGTQNGVNYLYAGSQDTATNTNGNYVHPYNLMTFFSGALSDASLRFYAVPDQGYPTGARWNDFEAGEQEYAYTISNQEFSWFFKDDWKLTSDLTLNLGVRWEYYGVPHASDGRTLGLKGGSKSAWGISKQGDFFNNGKSWVVDREYLSGFQRDANGNPVLPPPVIEYEFIGPDSPNPGRSAWSKDLNNFAPHVGFAWQLPWFGKGLTTLRGGYSASYSQVSNFNTFPGWFVNVAAAGVVYTETFRGVGNPSDPSSTNYYMDLTDLKNILPLKASASVLPMGVQQNDAIFTSGSIVMDENITNPYVHSLNASITRSVGRMFTVDVRYVGTFSRNAIGGLNVNQNFFLDDTLFNWITELDKVRAGGESMYINSLIPQNPQSGQMYYSTVAGQTGSAQVRQQDATNLARGVYNTIVSGFGTQNGRLPTVTGTERGMLMRSGCLPGDRPGYQAAFTANPQTDVTNYPCSVGTPLNMFYAAPQYANSTIQRNTNQISNYNSMQAQITMRPTHGLNFQATYTWSRNLSNSGWTNYLGDRDYTLSSQHRSHTLRFFGSYELPFGPRGLFLRDASSPVRKTVEGWQLSWVMSMESGPPLSLTGSSVLFGRNWPILVRPDLWDDKQGKARMPEWTTDADGNRTFAPGSYFAREYTWVLDTKICNPDRMTAALYSGQCLNDSAPRALALATRDAKGFLIPATYDGNYNAPDGTSYSAGDPIVVFRNADQSDGRNAGGNYKPNRLTAQGRFSLDMAATKRIEFMEGKTIEIRVDSQNILNHATPIGPEAPTAMESGGRYVSIDNPTSLSINSRGLPFGSMNNKVGHRTFQAKVALRF